MSELLIPRIEEQDIQAPRLRAEATTCVLQRHAPYQQDRSAESAGSITNTDVYRTDLAFFNDLLAQETADGPRVLFLFAASDTQYGSGYRSMETTALALQAAKAALQKHSVEPNERIINLNTAFKTTQFPEAEEPIRPLPRLREPQLWGPEAADYLAHLLEEYGNAETGVLSTDAWAAHEGDTERAARETAGVEGIHDIIDRTKQTLGFIARYAQIFHANNPNTHLVVWAGTHYDTISPLVKDATATPLDQYIPVANGGGVVIDLPSDGEARLYAQQRAVRLNLGKRALGS